MANSRNVYQQKTTVSIPKQELLNIVVYNHNLNKKDLKIILLLLTEIDGWSEPENGKKEDPMNFKHISCKKIAKTLQMDTKDVNKSLSKLIDENILEEGISRSASGVRFTF